MTLPRRLYLVRHGSAEPSQVDASRPLSAHGRDEVEKVASRLRERGASVARIQHSGKARARETAEIMAAQMVGVESVDAVPGLQPNDPTEPWAVKVDSWGEDGMLVGHLPFMARLAARLVLGDESRAIVDLGPASVVCLEKTERDRWTVASVLSPKHTRG
jgi:phosphohistidine phosphatase